MANATTNLDIGKAIESFLREIYGLIVKCVRTTWDYCFRPSSFVLYAGIAPESDVSIDPAPRYIRPVTYIALTWPTFCLFIVYVSAVDPTIITAGSEEYKKIAQLVASQNKFSILLAVIPMVLFVAMHSLSLSVAARLIHQDLSFEAALRIDAYFLGSLFLVNVVFGAMGLVGELLRRDQRSILLWLPLIAMSFVEVVLMALIVYRWATQVRRASSSGWIVSMLIVVLSIVIVLPLTGLVVLLASVLFAGYTLVGGTV